MTDVTNASRTLMMDLATAEWHADTLAALGLKSALGATSPLRLLPRRRPCPLPRRTSPLCPPPPPAPAPAATRAAARAQR